jgi:hypothetical protein
MRETMKLRSMTVLVAALCLSVLAKPVLSRSAGAVSDSESNRLFGHRRENAAFKADHDKVTDRAHRILQTTYPTIDVKNFRRDQTLVFKNPLQSSEWYNKSIQLELKSDSDGAATSPAKTLKTPKSVFLGNDKTLLVVQMDPKTQLDNEYLYITIGNGTSTTTYRSEEKIYQYYDSGASGMMGVSLGLAIVYMIFAFCCWCGGLRQFYHLIKIPQMLFMLNLLASKPQSASFFSLLENFRHNLFDVIPNPVVIDEQMGNECQLPIQFFAEMLSCHVYNSLKNYVLGFIIFSVLYGFIATNKFHDRDFFIRLRRTMDYHIFMLTILPDVGIAIYLNAVAGLNNSVLSFGFLLCVLLAIWYFHIFNTVLGYYFGDQKQELVNFLKFFMFSRSQLNKDDNKLGLKFLAVVLEHLKILVVVTMIALFFNAPRTQMVIVFLAYLLNAAFLLVFRPYSNLLQNLFFAGSDLAFFLIVVLVLARHDNFEKTSTESREDKYGGAQSAMVFIVFFLNLFVYVVPALKGHDRQAVLHHSSLEANEEINAPLQGKSAKTVELSEGQKLSDVPKVNESQKLSESQKASHVESKETLTKEILCKQKTPVVEREAHTADARSSRQFTQGSEIPLNKEEQMPMKPKETENPAMQPQRKKIEVKGIPPSVQKDLKPSEENPLRGDVDKSHETAGQGRDLPPTAHNSTHQPRMNNLISSTPVEPSNAISMSQAQSVARLDVTPPHELQTSQMGRSGELPPVKTGKVSVKRTFKASDPKNQDFEGM